MPSALQSRYSLWCKNGQAVGRRKSAERFSPRSLAWPGCRPRWWRIETSQTRVLLIVQSPYVASNKYHVLNIFECVRDETNQPCTLYAHPSIPPATAFRPPRAQISVEGRKHGSEKVMRSKLHLVRKNRNSCLCQQPLHDLTWYSYAGVVPRRAPSLYPLVLRDDTTMHVPTRPMFARLAV